MCFALGIIISVTKKKMKKLNKKDAAKRSTKKLIDAELASEEEDLEDYSIDKAANPMNAVLNK
jgi:hypothetical protein